MHAETCRPRCHQCAEYGPGSEDCTPLEDPDAISYSEDINNRSSAAYIGLSHSVVSHRQNHRQTTLIQRPMMIGGGGGNTATIRHLPSNFNNHNNAAHNRHPIPPMVPPINNVSPPMIPPKQRHHNHICHHQKQVSQSSLPPLSFYQNLQSNGDGSTPNISRSFAMEMREARAKAILVDRISRIFFPLSFTILNVMYWFVYFEW